MPGIKRNHKMIFDYLMKYGKATQLTPILKIARNFEGKERIRKYKLYIDELVESGQINTHDVYKAMYKKVEEE